MRGLGCFGPNRGRETTYTSPKRWLPDLTPATNAMPDLLLRTCARSARPRLPARRHRDAARTAPAPYFDTYAYAVGNDRARLNPGTAANRAKGNFQVLLVDGVVGGLWRQKRSGRRLAVTVEPCQRLTARRGRELAEQVSRIGTILGVAPESTIGEVTVGGHA